MRKSTTDRMNDYYAVVMGVFEPILVLSVWRYTRSVFAYSTSRMDIEMTRSEWGPCAPRQRLRQAAAASAHHRRGRCERLSGPESVSVMGPHPDPPG